MGERQPQHPEVRKAAEKIKADIRRVEAEMAKLREQQTYLNGELMAYRNALDVVEAISHD